jgi:LmbE family N-acetylglucosaminyl deacetylase
MAVHAHPDDEVVFTGGTLLKYHRLGARTVLVTATGGEEGEIHDPDLDPEAARPNLREIRLEELRRGIALLEIDHLELLGYRDSGMAGTEANAHPDNFHNADVEEATRKLVRLVRQYRPEIMITYDEFGAYGHPDHIKCNVITHRAFDRAGDRAYAPDLGEPWTPLKLYYSHWNEDAWKQAREMFLERGLKWPWDPEEQKPDEDPEHQSVEEAVAEHVQDEAPEEAQPKAEEPAKEPEYVPPPTTTRIDVRDFVLLKRDSTLQHRTQFDPNGLFTTMPEDIAPVVFGEEHYSLVASRVPAPAEEDDLLAGLQASAGAPQLAARD